MVEFLVKKKTSCQQYGAEQDGGKWYNFFEFVAVFERESVAHLKTNEALIEFSEQLDQKFAKNNEIEYVVDGTHYIITKP